MIRGPYKLKYKVLVHYHIGQSKYLSDKGYTSWERSFAERLRDEYVMHAAQLCHLVKSTELILAE